MDQQDQAPEQSSDSINPVTAFLNQQEGAFDEFQDSTEHPGTDDALASDTDSQPDGADTDDSDTNASDAEGALQEDEDDTAEEDSEEEQTESEEDTESESESDDDAELIDNDDAVVEVDGERMTLAELKAGQMKARDYTQKTQELARQRKEVETIQEQYAGQLAWFEAKATEAMKPFENLDWQRLKVEDPAQYQAAQQQYAQVQQSVDQMKQHQEEFLWQAQQQRNAQLKAQAQESVKQLKSLVPDWSDKTYGEIRQFAVDELGFDAAEYNQIADHRPIYALYLAMQQTKGKESAREKVKQKTVNSKLKPKASKRPTTKDGRKKASMSKASQRLARDGSDAAAADWFRAQLPDDFD